MKAITLLMRSLLIVAMAAVPLFAQSPTPTDNWTDFGSFSSTINGVLIPAGTEITAFDPQGVLCGKTITTVVGRYGALSVYGDDQFTPSVDEGCVMGDHVTFKINGVVAHKLIQYDDVWAGKGPTRILDLALTDATTFGVSANSPTDGKDSAKAVVVYPVTANNLGNGTNLIALSITSSHGWTVTGTDSAGQYYLLGESKVLGVSVAIPPLTPTGVQDTLTVTVYSRFDGPSTVTRKIVTTVDNVTGVDGDNFNIPGMFTLNQNFPNPFNPETVISFSLDKPGDVTLAVFDILGRRVTTLYQGYLAAGQHQFRWNGTDEYANGVASGVYFYRLSSEQVSLTRKMALMK